MINIDKLALINYQATKPCLVLPKPWVSNLLVTMRFMQQVTIQHFSLPLACFILQMFLYFLLIVDCWEWGICCCCLFFGGCLQFNVLWVWSVLSPDDVIVVRLICRCWLVVCVSFSPLSQSLWWEQWFSGVCRCAEDFEHKKQKTKYTQSHHNDKNSVLWCHFIRFLADIT